jgi:hypothetical protein
MPFKIANILTKCPSILVDMVGLFDSFNMKEIEACKVFDPKCVLMYPRHGGYQCVDRWLHEV